MPLRDLFHRPLSEVHEWEALHTQWGGCIAADLNRRLPKRFLASSPTHLGPFVSADVAERELLAGNSPSQANGPHGPPTGNGGIAVAAEPEVYAPATDLSMPATFPDEYTVEIRDTTRGSRVIAVIELVSPANKKEADAREQFAAKCMSYLGKGIGLVVIDTVTERLWNLHNEFIRLANYEDKFLMAGDPPIYVTAYRPVHRDKKDLIDLWTWPLVVGTALPVVPLALKGYGCVRLELETTYLEACERNRIE
jgi:hypothetical protein